MDVGRSIAILLVAAVLPLGTTTVSAAADAPGPADSADTETPNAAPLTVPAIQQWQGGNGSLRLTQRGSIAVEDPVLLELGEQLAAELIDDGLPALRVTDGPADPGDIGLRLHAGGEQTEDSYLLEIDDRVTITAGTETGAFYGTRTLLQALRTSAEFATLPQGRALDWPHIDGQRGQMLDIRTFFSLDYLKQQIRQLGWYKLNTFHLHLSDWNSFRIQSDRFPGLTSPQAYSKAEIRELQDYAARYHVMIIPEIDMPGHASHIGNYRPSLAFECESMSYPSNMPWEGSGTGNWTMDVTSPETIEFVTELLEEMLPLFDGPYFHIGGDEIPSVSDQQLCPELVAYQQEQGYEYTADVFVEFINTLNDVVRAHGKTTEVWQWWDFQRETSILPDRDVVVDEWLNAPDDRVAQGYQTVGAEESQLYVSPGFGTRPGQYGYFDPREVFRYEFKNDPGFVGYKVSRWADRAHEHPASWFDFYARRPLAVLADRTWGAPASDVREFFDRYDRVGDADPSARGYGENPGMISQQGWTAVQGRNDGSRAIDGDPYTGWEAFPESEPLLEIDFGSRQRIAGIRYLPPPEGEGNPVRDYRLLASDDGVEWRPVTSGRFADTHTETVVRFGPIETRFLGLQVVSGHGPVPSAKSAVNELDAVRAR
ncbi:family 20 glycosylhydrolase [Actinoalloteichus hymeniacidonis]|uniref:beta-N-acetylhexosaminidase n=1 Tax=Actinoalloteichus hymeniacidonis TaxID=340345 RepID=A0AAC9HS37_9PSEU|nr:family 20 glycosylhydrolase [Actinoalloteichus hymeniacidonis]AOS64151.1 N-acetyl-beta-hexosaminidase [Actinoalloteichus hymeniacidonis]MBB5907783.1 hexosaminidase [Actinoalloteichus hymeniacidonis]